MSQLSAQAMTIMQQFINPTHIYQKILLHINTNVMTTTGFAFIIMQLFLKNKGNKQLYIFFLFMKYKLYSPNCIISQMHTSFITWMQKTFNRSSILSITKSALTRETSLFKTHSTTLKWPKNSYSLSVILYIYFLSHTISNAQVISKYLHSK